MSLETARQCLQEQRYLAALEALFPNLYDQTPSVEATTLRDEIFAALRQQMQESTLPPKRRMKFGTSGWRGMLGEDFTVHNVACVTQGLIDTLLRPELHQALGVSSAEELCTRGCVIGHDTRIMGPEFSAIAARVLLAAGVRVYLLGMSSTPEVSAAIEETNAAFSINFTPSHNPFSYHGYKFNPADGGPATSVLTSPVAVRANEIIDNQLGYQAISETDWEAAQQDPSRVQVLDPIALYKQSLARRMPFLSLPTLVETVNRSDIAIFVDNGFGASTGKYEKLLEGIAPEKLVALNNSQDYLFGGKSREPSAENFRALQQAMQSSSAKLVVGIMNDGDSDRFLGGGREAVVPMNIFGPMVVRYLSKHHDLRGDITRSVMTSHMADAAQRRYQPQGSLHETAVGFQYLKGFIQHSVNSWEESDGMSPMSWSRDKDGLIAALLLIAMMLEENKTVETLRDEIEAELGTFYFDRQKVTAQQQGEALTQALHEHFSSLTEGSEVMIADRAFAVAKRVTLDGTKIVFDNGWWFGVRPSGTEPVVRPYVETFTGAGASEAEKLDALRWQKKIMAWLKNELASL